MSMHKKDPKVWAPCFTEETTRSVIERAKIKTQKNISYKSITKFLNEAAHVAWRWRNAERGQYRHKEKRELLEKFKACAEVLHRLIEDEGDVESALALGFDLRRIAYLEGEAFHLSMAATAAIREMPKGNPGNPESNESLAIYIHALAGIYEKITGKPAGQTHAGGGPFFRFVRSCIGLYNPRDKNLADITLGKLLDKVLRERKKH